MGVVREGVAGGVSAGGSGGRAVGVLVALVVVTVKLRSVPFRSRLSCCIDVQFVSLPDSVKAWVSGSQRRGYIAERRANSEDQEPLPSLRLELIPPSSSCECVSRRLPRPLLPEALTKTYTNARTQTLTLTHTQAPTMSVCLPVFLKHLRQEANRCYL